MRLSHAALAFVLLLMFGRKTYYNLLITSSVLALIKETQFR